MGKVSRRHIVRMAGGAAAVAGIAGPFVHSGQAQAKKLVIGGSIPLSGRAAETGVNVNNGYQLAVKQLNGLGGVQIAGETYMLELRMFDDASDPSRATTLIQRQIDEGVDFFVGSFGSNIVLPTAAIIDRSGKIMVQTGGGSDQIFTQGYKNVFGMYPRASWQFRSTAQFFQSLDPKAQTFSTIATNDAFSKTFAQGAQTDCKAVGLQQVDAYLLPEQITDVSSVLASVRAKTPDLLICCTHDQNSLLIARQMIASNTNVKLLYQGLGPQLASYRETLGKFGNGIVSSTYWDERAPFKDAYFESASKYYEIYKKSYDRPMAYHTPGGTACIITYVEAMKQAKSIKPAAVREALSAIRIDTLYGPIKFSPEGDADAILMGPKTFQVQKGIVELVFPADAATGKVVWPAPPWKERS